jgi:Zn-dependent peptidase ImmA (M78 family)
LILLKVYHTLSAQAERMARRKVRMREEVAPAEVETSALDLLRAAGIQRPPVPVFALARRVGICDIARARMDSEALTQFGGITADYSVRWGVLLRRDRSATTRRFSLAHEIGHIVMKAFEREGPGHKLQEDLMEQFAACLLVPGEWVSARRRRGATVAQLASVFGVPPRLVAARLRALAV